jgi:hypothetical protein
LRAIQPHTGRYPGFHWEILRVENGEPRAIAFWAEAVHSLEVSVPPENTPVKKPRSRLRVFFSVKRALIDLAVLAVAGGIFWLFWTPGEDIRDGRHDRGENGLWLAHGWMGGDEWFSSNGKEAEKPKYRSPEALTALTARVREHGIRDLFPHLCPLDSTGALPPVDAASTEKFLDAVQPARVWPWVGGMYLDGWMGYEPWRKNFAAGVRRLLEAHPRLAGVQINIEPMTSGTASYLTVLDEVRAALPPGRKLSVAAYPPPTRWQPSQDVHWNEAYFREVAKRCDHLAVMMYDTGVRFQKPYQKLMADWTEEILKWSEGRPVLLGLAAYDDKGVEYHHPEVENLTNGLAGIHAGLMRFDSLPDQYRGVAIYCDWEMDAAEWKLLEERFGKPGAP